MVTDELCYGNCDGLQHCEGTEEDSKAVLLLLHYLTVWTQGGTAAWVPVLPGKAFFVIFCTVKFVLASLLRYYSIICNKLEGSLKSAGFHQGL